MTALPAAPLARTPSQRARRDRIVQAAMRLLDDRDYDRIQVRHVAEEAHVALGTLYRYFPSKEQLYAHVLLAWSEPFEARARSDAPGARSDAERLRLALRRVVRAYEKRPTYYRLITALEVVGEPAVVELYGEFARRFSGALHGTLRTTSGEEADAIALVCSATLGALLRSWSLGKSSIRRVYDDVDRVVALLFART